MKKLSKQQRGSFFAEIGAVVASISILTLVSTNYMDSMSGRAQVTEAFVLMAPLIENVNTFYSTHGIIGGTTGNYDGIDVYDNNGHNDAYDATPVTDGSVTAIDFAGRYVKDVQSFSTGVVMAQMNPQHNDSTYNDGYVGKVSNVQQAIQDTYIFYVPFLIGDAANTVSDETSLRWACLTTINANPPSGDYIDPLSTTVINEQYFYAPGCVVISKDQANCLLPGGGDQTSDATNLKIGTGTCTAGNIFDGPEPWGTPLINIVS